MKLKLIFFNAFLVSFSIIVQTYTTEENNFKNLFESVANHNHRRGEIYYEILKDDAAKEQQIFNIMKKNLWSTKNNAGEKYFHPNRIVTKRETYKKNHVFARAVHDAKCSNNVEELSVNEFIFQINGSSLSCRKDEVKTCEKPDPWWKQRIMHFMEKHPDLEHVDIECLSCDDEMLQIIFKNMVNLKTLSMCVRENTNFGIIGRLGNERSTLRTDVILNYAGKPIYHVSDPPVGYSINRLRNLEELTLIGYKFSSLSDTIFFDFDFPKLRYLLTDPPDDPPKVLPIMGEKLPSLETLYFSHQMFDYENPNVFVNNSEKSLVSFCRHTKKLQKIILRKTSFKGKMELSDIVDIFKVCPSLRSIEGYQNDNASYDPITRTVVITDGRDLNKTFIIQ